MKAILTKEYFSTHAAAVLAWRELECIYPELKGEDFGTFLIGFLAGVEYCSTSTHELKEARKGA